jgi:hypothetical protein
MKTEIKTIGDLREFIKDKPNNSEILFYGMKGYFFKPLNMSYKPLCIIDKNDPELKITPNGNFLVINFNVEDRC